MSTTDKDLQASLNVLAKTLRSVPDILRAQRVDKAIANDGTVIRDQDVGLIKMIANIDALRADLEEYEISLIDKLLKLRGELNDPVHGTFLYDTFTGSDGSPLTAHTGETGATWTSDGGSFNVTNGRVQGTSTGFVLASGLPPSPDYVVFAEFTRFTDDGENAIAVRIQPGTDTAYVLYYNYGNFRLHKRINGVQTSLGDYPYAVGSLPVVAGLAIAGNEIDVFVKGALVMSRTDTSITARGRAGLFSRPVGPTTGQHFDNVRGSGYVAVVSLVDTLKNVLSDALNDEEANRIAADNALDAAKRALNVAIPQADVSGLVTALNNKLEPGTSQANISGLVTALNNKRSTSVDVPQADVSGLVTALNNKLEPGTSQANVSGLVSALASKLADADNPVRRKTTNQAIDSTSPVVVSGLGFSVSANQRWEVSVKIPHATNAGGFAYEGAGFGLTGPSGTSIDGFVRGIASDLIGRADGMNDVDIPSGGGTTIPCFTKYETTLGYAVIEALVTTGGFSGTVNVVADEDNVFNNLTILSNARLIARKIT